MPPMCSRSCCRQRAPRALLCRASPSPSTLPLCSSINKIGLSPESVNISLCVSAGEVQSACFHVAFRTYRQAEPRVVPSGRRTIRAWKWAAPKSYSWLAVEPFWAVTAKTTSGRGLLTRCMVVPAALATLLPLAQPPPPAPASGADAPCLPPPACLACFHCSLLPSAVFQL